MKCSGYVVALATLLCVVIPIRMFAVSPEARVGPWCPVARDLRSELHEELPDSHRFPNAAVFSPPDIGQGREAATIETAIHELIDSFDTIETSAIERVGPSVADKHVLRTTSEARGPHAESADKNRGKSNSDPIAELELLIRLDDKLRSSKQEFAASAAPGIAKRAAHPCATFRSRSSSPCCDSTGLGR